jgi:hypothetical protein
MIHSPSTAGADLWKFSDKRRYSICKHAERENGWLVGYPEGGLIEKYLSGHMAIAWRRAEALGGNPVQDGFVVELLKAPLSISERNPTIGNLGLNDEKSFVLPFDVELMDGVQHHVPAVVSFCFFDRSSLDSSYPLFAFEHVYGVEKIGVDGANGEVGLAVRFFTISKQQGRHQEIECGTRGIDDSPDITVDERIEGKIGIGDEQIPSRIARIRLGDDFVWASPLPLHQSLLQDWDLGLGPIDCRFGASEVIAHGI